VAGTPNSRVMPSSAMADAEGTQCVEFGNGGTMAVRMLASVVGYLNRAEDATSAAVIANEIDLAL